MPTITCPQGTAGQSAPDPLQLASLAVSLTTHIRPLRPRLSSMTRIPNFRRASSACLSLVLLLASTQTVFADIFTIEDGDSRFTWTNTDNGEDGNTDFINENDAEDILADWQYAESWFIKQGLFSGELLDGTSDIDASLKFGTVNFANFGGAFDVSIRYELTERSAETQFLEVEATITNISANSLDFALINYFDYDIDGEAIDHTAEVIDDGTGWLQMDVTLPDVASVRRRAKDADRFQIAEYQTLYDSIVAGNNLDNTGSPFGPIDEDNPGDFTGAYQWDLSLASGESVTLTSLVVAGVPEPPVHVALLLATIITICILAFRRKRTASPN